MSVFMRKNLGMLLLIFCCIFLSESVAAKGDSIGRMPARIAEEEYENVAVKENGRKYVKIYIDEETCIKIDLILILGCVTLLFIIVLERMR